MQKQLIALSFFACCLTASSGLAQNVKWTCKAERGNGTQFWVWTAESQNYSWHKVNQMCSASGALKCNIKCKMTAMADPNPSSTSSYSCVVHGLHGHMFYGTGPTMSHAHQNALQTCRANGLTPCSVDTCIRS
jgi:hypothetical protein